MVSCSWATFRGTILKKIITCVVCVLCDDKSVIDVCMCMGVSMCDV